jgi:hypothetical protein
MTDPRFRFPYDPRMALSAPQMISNRGRFLSATELGRVFDPIMYRPSFADASETKALLERGLIPVGGVWPDAAAGRSSPHHGGGNTLRIGRPEHAAFEAGGGRGRHAALLLDLFHAGIPGSETVSEREGPLVMIEGRVNLNTATRDALRALAAGALVMDPALAENTQNAHDASMMPPVVPLSLGAPQVSAEADRVADAIIRSRPFASSAKIAFARQPDGVGAFGDRRLYPEGGRIEWTDSACEEVFARIHQSSTVRSRNFRVWIVAQTLAPAAPAAKPEVLAEVRKSFALFADPGKRRSNGLIDPDNARTTIISTNEF